MSQFFEISIFSQDIWGNVHYVPEINLISSGTLIKAFIFQEKQIKRNLRHGFVRRTTAEDNNAKINVCPNIPCAFFLFKASASLQFFLPRNLLFRQVFRTSVFLSSKCLPFLYLFISLLKNIH